MPAAPQRSDLSDAFIPRAGEAVGFAEALFQDAQIAVRKREQDAKIAVAKAKYSDYDTVLNDVIAKNPTVRSLGIEQAFREVEDMGEVLYALADNNGAEYLRIAALPERQAYRETLRLDDRIQANIAAANPPKDTKPPEKQPKPAVSRVPAPYTPANGVEALAATSAAPQSYEAFLALDKQKRKAA